MSIVKLELAIVVAVLLGVSTLFADDKKADIPAPPTAAHASAPGNDFVIGEGDVLQISVWKEPDLSGPLPVRPDGCISMALLNDVQATGLTPMQLADSITEKLKKFISDPHVSVVVREINSRKYYILGEVHRPGAFPLNSGMTVLQGISAAGGLSEFANSSKISLMRKENGKMVRHPFNYKQVVRGENGAQNELLKPGDTIVVP
jgi:polysaccharide export outer membrane protein